MQACLIAQRQKEEYRQLSGSAASFKFMRGGTPAMTVSSHKPKAPSVPSRLHARQMAAAMREAMPRGDVHRTAVTIFPITVLNTCEAGSLVNQVYFTVSLQAVQAAVSQALSGRLNAFLL